MLLSQCPSQPAEFLEQKQVLSTLQTIPSPEQLGKYSISVPLFELVEGLN